MVVQSSVMNTVCTEDLMADGTYGEAFFGRNELTAMAACAENIGHTGYDDWVFDFVFFHSNRPFLFDSPFFSAHGCADEGAILALCNGWLLSHPFFFMPIFSKQFGR